MTDIQRIATSNGKESNSVIKNIFNPYMKNKAWGFYPEKGEISYVDNALVDKLILETKKDKLKLGRYCMHKDEKSKLMSMVILILEKYVYPPHRHAWKDECYTLIEGRCTYEEYDELGNVTYSRELEAGMSLMNSNKTFHTLKPKSDVVCFIESTVGPFTDNNIEFL